jgi:hypothetical protein
MCKAAQGFLPEAYLKYVEGGKPRRTPLIEKIAIYGWKLTKHPKLAGPLSVVKLF